MRAGGRGAGGRKPPPRRLRSRREPEAGKGRAETGRLVGLAPRVPCLSGPLAGGRGAMGVGAPLSAQPRETPDGYGLLSHPHLGSHPAGEDGCLGSLHGERSPEQQFPVFNEQPLSFTVTLTWSWGPGAPLSDGQARVGGRRLKGASCPLPPPLAAPPPRSPNWRGTGFSTASRGAAGTEGVGALSPHSRGRGGYREDPFGETFLPAFWGAGVCFVNI